MKLVRKNSIMEATYRNKNSTGASISYQPEHSLFEGEQSTIPASAPISDHIDLVSTELQSTILVMKPYATILYVPLWQPREAGSPFLLCFPRGTADYRLYGIFPSDDASEVAWSAEKPPLLPLVMPRRIQSVSNEASASEMSGTNVTQNRDLYGVVVVFKKRRSRPAIFVAICLANIGQRVNGDKSSTTVRPCCKIIPDWVPSKAEYVQDIDFNASLNEDAAGETLVTVQKVASNPRTSAKGSEPRFVGLTQVVFDRTQMMDELHLLPNKASKAPMGILQHYGLECSEEDVDDLI